MKLHKTLFCIVGLFTILSLQSCADNDFKELNSDIIKQTNYEINTEYFDVTAENKVIKGIQTNNLTCYQLGEYSQNPFGKTKASIVAQVSFPNNISNVTFGRLSQAMEEKENYNEQEKVVSVKLNIPFFSTEKEKKKVGEKVETIYTLDSIYGAKDANFDITVHESEYYLRNIDDSLEKSKVYFSNLTIKNNFKGRELAVKTGMKIDDKEVIYHKFDDPTTGDKDESKEEMKRSAPMLSVDLDSNFFQSKILDKEGSRELEDPEAFKLYFKGIIIETSNFNKEMLMLLDFTNANIEIIYEYKNKKDNKDYIRKDRVLFPLSGIKINLFDYENDNVDTSSKKNIFLQGGKRFAELTILKEEDINRIKNEDWLINDAVLIFKVDSNNTVKEIPERLYIYNSETGESLANYYFSHLKKYDKTTNSYEIKVQSHISNIISKGDKNVKLGVVVAQNINQETKVINQNKVSINHVAPIEYLKEDNTIGKIPVTTATTPLSVTLYGNDASVKEDNRLRLKITYTKLTK